MIFNDYVDYWRTLQIQHNQLNFFARMFEEEQDDALRRDIQPYALILNDYDGAITWLKSGQWLDVMEGSIMLLGRHALRTDTHDALEDMLSELKEIGFQLFGRIFHDIEQKNHCPAPLINIKRESIEYYRTPVILDEYTGWFFNFKMTAQVTGQLAFDPAVWTIE